MDIYRVILSERKPEGYQFTVHFDRLPTNEEVIVYLLEQINLMPDELAKDFLETNNEDLFKLNLPKQFDKTGYDEHGKSLGKIYIFGSLVSK